jgi:hypothetical protein
MSVDYTARSSSSLVARDSFSSLIIEPQSEQSQVDKVDKTSSNIFINLLSSRILRSSVFSAAATGAFLFLFSNPASWIILGGVALTAFAISLVAQVVFDRLTHKKEADISEIDSDISEIDSDVRFRNIDEYLEYVDRNYEQLQLVKLRNAADLIDKKLQNPRKYLFNLVGDFITNESIAVYLIKYRNSSLEEALNEIKTFGKTPEIDEEIVRFYVELNKLNTFAELINQKLEATNKSFTTKILYDLKGECTTNEGIAVYLIKYRNSSLEEALNKIKTFGKTPEIDKEIVKEYGIAIRENMLFQEIIDNLPKEIFKYKEGSLYFVHGEKIVNSNFIELDRMDNVINLNDALDINVDRLSYKVEAGNICINNCDMNKDIALTIAAFLMKYEEMEYKEAFDKVNSIMGDAILTHIELSILGNYQGYLESDT